MESRHYGKRALFVGLGAFSLLLGSAVPAGALSTNYPPPNPHHSQPRMVCVAKNGSYVRPITRWEHCKPWETLIKFDELVRGPRGYRGPTGPTGPQGDTGDTGPALEPVVVPTAPLPVGVSGLPQTFSSTCPVGTTIIAGGYSAGVLPISASFPDTANNRWSVTVPSNVLIGATITVYAVCVPAVS